MQTWTIHRGKPSRTSVDARFNLQSNLEMRLRMQNFFRSTTLIRKLFYILLVQPRPLLLILANFAAIKNPHPTAIELPANALAPVYPAGLAIMAPAIGGPVSTAKLTIVKTMPIRTPSLRRSVVRKDRAAGKRLWMPAPTIP